MTKHISSFFPASKKIYAKNTYKNYFNIKLRNNTNFNAFRSSLLIYSNGSSSDATSKACMLHPNISNPQINKSQAIFFIFENIFLLMSRSCICNSTHVFSIYFIIYFVKISLLHNNKIIY